MSYFNFKNIMWDNLPSDSESEEVLEMAHDEFLQHVIEAAGVCFP